MSDHLTLVLNLKRKAPSQYCDYDFNSMVKFNGAYIGAGDDGIFQLFTGDTDDDGAEGAAIAAFIELPKSNMGIPNMKRFRRMYFGYIADGNLSLTLTVDDTAQTPVAMAPYLSDKQSHQVVNITRVGQGAYWQIRIDNVDGADFTIDSIHALINVLGRKPR
jgi:hypothetical protein